VFLTVVALGIAVNFWIPKQYSTSATILLDTTAGGTVPQGSVAIAAEERFLREQTALISSSNMALRVVDALGLDKSTEARQLYATESMGKGTLKAWLAESLLKKVAVHASSDANVIDIEFTSSDPQLAALVTNMYVQTYARAVSEAQSNSSKRKVQYAQRQLAELRDNMTGIEKNITEVQQQDEYAAIDDRYATENKRLQELRSHLAASSAKAPEAVLAHLRSEFDVQQNKVAEIKTLQTKLKGLQSNLEVLQRSHDFAMQRLWQESFNERAETFSVVNLRAAEIPERPAVPRLWINLPLAFFIALVLALGTAVVAETIDRRIRTEADVTQTLGLPVLARVAL
jgi:uncharacterized protein involved in exopolysaccharide biosynthesis